MNLSGAAQFITKDIRCMWLFRFKLSKSRNLKVSSSADQSIFQVLNGHMWLMAIILDSAEYFYYHKVLSDSPDLECIRKNNKS